MNIAIAVDGPAGAGKSTISKAAAERLGFLYIDTGAMYRAAALYVVEHGKDAANEDDVKLLLPEIDIDLRDGKVYLCGDDVTGKIRTPEISVASSNIAVFPCVRNKLCALQREMAKRQSVIMDGRDVGTYVLPDAEVKVFLTTSAEVRAQRRLKELQEKGIESSYDEVLSDIQYRDKNDSTRKMAPLKKADDAVELDTGNLTIDESIEALISIYKEKTNA
ncbi:MAG: (d)CMP kinase [Clostridia bacterium]|nr:(d)CMP kinase [Clostridia bacterium]